MTIRNPVIRSYTKSVGDLVVQAIAASDQQSGLYALFSGSSLFLADIHDDTVIELIRLNNIMMDCEITIGFHNPFIYVAERFGVNAFLYNLTTGNTKKFSREDHHCDVSSYSVGFTEQNGRILFVIQTKWNRLDIFDAESGAILTEREVYCNDSGRKDAEGHVIFDEKNYLDYFHSRLHFAPDGEHFLSNGWVWHPFSQVRLFETTDFFQSFEPGSAATDDGFWGYWDRPCTFIDNDQFVIVMDDAQKAGAFDLDGERANEYKALAFFRISDGFREDQHGFRWIYPFRLASCNAFVPDDDGEVCGQLFYDDLTGYLVAVTPDGASP